MARYWIALALADQRHPDRAIAVLDSALAADPADARCRQLLGMLRARPAPVR
jgi:cytochrome c-type biogenesis protein CcmH/NrfG